MAKCGFGTSDNKLHLLMIGLWSEWSYIQGNSLPFHWVYSSWSRVTFMKGNDMFNTTHGRGVHNFLLFNSVEIQ